MELQPASYTQGACTTAQNDRTVTGDIVCVEGVANISAGSLTVTQSTPAAMSVDVSSGGAFIQGDNVANQGKYHVYNAGTVTLPIAAADPTDPRIDLVIAHVYDAQYAGALNEWHLEVVSGSASPVPAVPVLPPNAIPLAQVNVPANTTSITSANITDKRQPYQICADSVPAPTQAVVRAHINADSGVRASGAWAANFVFVNDELVNFTHDAQSTWTAQVAGLYWVSFTLSWASNATGYRGVRLNKNSGTFTQNVLAAAINGGQTPITYTQLIRLAVGDTIGAEAYQSSGASLAMRGDAAGNFSTMSVVRVGA